MPSQPEPIAVDKEPSKTASPRKSRSPTKSKSSMKSKSPKPAKKKPARGDKKSAPKSHPPFLKMVKDALSKLDDRKGSARVTILKYIMANYRIEEEETKIKNSVNKALKNGLKSEELKKANGLGLSGRFKLNIKPKRGAKKEEGQEKETTKKAPKKPKAKVAGRSKQKQSEAAGGSGDMMKPAAPKGKKTTRAPKKVSPKKPTVAKKSAGKMSMGKSGKAAGSGRKAPAAKAKKGMTTPKAAKKAVSKK